MATCSRETGFRSLQPIVPGPQHGIEFRDEAGFAEGWVSAAFVSNSPVPTSYVHVDLDAYKEPKTPTVIEGISAKYVGVSACVPCHNKPHASFALGPYGVWRDHFHSKAYQTLTRAYTRAFARKRGVDDPLTNWRCRKCHVTAYGVPAERLAETYRDEDGVSCEACHGPGGDYLYKHFREDVNAGELQAMGFRKFSDLEQRDTLCRSCHNTLSPTYKPFNVVYFSNAIRHWQNEYRIETSGSNQSPVVHAPEPVAPPMLPAPENIDALLRPLAAQQPAKKSPGANGTVSSITARLAGLPKEWMLNRTVTLRDARDVYPVRTYAYVAAGREGLAIVDIEQPDMPKLIDTYSAEGQLNDVTAVITGTVNASMFAFIADGRNGLRVVRLLGPPDTPGHLGFSPRPVPKLVATYKTKGVVSAIAEGVERDRPVDESGNQIGIAGRLGSHPLRKSDMDKLLFREGKIFTVRDD